MGWNAAQLAEAYGNSPELHGRVHLVNHVPRSARPGHLYVLGGVRRQPTFEQLARLSQHSRHAEAALYQINGVYLIQMGPAGVAVVTVFIPRRQDGIESARWIAHTHPLEQENWQQGIAHGPTDADRLALGAMNRSWGQSESTLLVCRRGRIERTVEFTLEQDDAASAFSGGQLWTPDPH